MGQLLCPYSKDMSAGCNCLLMCTLINEPCGLYRYCQEIKKPTMGNIYIKYGCNIKDKHENKKGVEDLAKKQVTKKPLPVSDVVEKHTNTNNTKVGNNTMIANVEYIDIKRNKTAVYYVSDKDSNTQMGCFIDGIYHGKLEIVYTGKTFDSKNIISVKELK